MAESQPFFPLPIGEEAVVSNSAKAVWQDVNEEAADEFVSGQGHGRITAAVSVVLPAEVNLAIVDRKQATIGDGDTMGIVADIFEDLLWPGERRLGIDDPFVLASRCEMTPESRPLLQRGQSGEKVESAGGECFLQMGEEQPAEAARQDPDRKEEVWAAGHPALAIG